MIETIDVRGGWRTPGVELKEAPISSCPKCGADFSEARQLLKEQTLAFCLRCKFPLVLVAGKYRLEKELAQGGYGVVFKARHIYLEQDSLRVVKILKAEVFQIPGMEQRFYREVQVTSALSQKDEHIIRIYDDFGKNANIGPFYVMEYLEGLRLDSLLVQSTHLPMLSFVMHIFRQLCQSIQLAHDAGIVHRDLKPENLYLIDKRGDPYFLKIIDFGIAKPLNQDELKMTQGVLGSPFYMAPEQCLNQQVDARADIYAMGCILFELLTGFPPFHPKLGNTQASSLVELLGAHVGMPPPPPREIRPERVSESMQDVLLCALEKNPTHRFQSAQEMLEALERAYQPLAPDGYVPSTKPKKNLPTGDGPPMERVSKALRTSMPTADFPDMSGISAGFDFSNSPIRLGGDLDSTSWDDLSADVSDTVVRSFFRTVQNTIRDEEGIQYYRAIFVLVLFLLGGVAIGWWVFFFTHGGRSTVLARGSVQGDQDAGTPVKRDVPSKPNQQTPRRTALVPDAGTPEQARPAVRSRPLRPRPARPHPTKRSPRRRVLARARARTSWHSKRPGKRRTRTRARPAKRRRPAVRVKAPSRRSAPRKPTQGCPAASDGVRWVRLDVRPSHIAATTRILSGVGQSYRQHFGFCLGLRSPVQLRIDANEFRPCVLQLSHKHARLAIRMKKDRMDAIETNHQYCLQ